MDFQRRVGLGRLSELLGEPTLEIDRFLRTIGTAEAARQDLDVVSPEGREALQAYADGVNAFMATNPPLPLEYRLLGAEWEPWEPLHTLAWGKMMQWDLSYNWGEELLRARLVERVGPEATALLLGDGTVVGAHASASIGNPDLSALAAAMDRVGLNLLSDGAGRGSNAWVVAGTRTATGRPILANDPHLSPGIPSIWYQIGLHAPGMDVVGASLPGAPAVVIGHNGHITWGVTTLGIDSQDLYIERLDERGEQYEWQGEMLPLALRQELIRVNDGEDVLLEVRETRHGPLINDVIDGFAEPVSFRWRAAAEPTHLIDAVLELNDATNREEFLDALRLWDSPPQNFVYADREGNTGYVAAGEIPVRPAEGGLLPQPGWTGEWEWQGVVPFEERPQVWNPDAGFLVTANERPFPDDYPYYTGSSWATRYRAERIGELLAGGEALALQDMQAIQGDLYSRRAEQLVPLLIAVPSDNIIVQRAQEQLDEWNRQVEGRLPGAGIFQVTHGFIVRELLADVLGDDEAGRALLEDYLGQNHKHLSLVSRLAEEPDHPLWNDTRTPERETRDDILHRALLEMADWLGRRYGDVPHEWFWDNLHYAPFDHPLGSVRVLEPLFNRRVASIGGDRTTVNANGFSYGGESYAADNVPSYRQVIDVGEWQNSRMLHTTGQSGQPFHRHYDDMLGRWQRVDLHPMLWTEQQTTEAGRGRTLILQPTSGP
jgi:penicillin G amidase